MHDDSGAAIQRVTAMSRPAIVAAIAALAASANAGSVSSHGATAPVRCRDSSAWRASEHGPLGGGGVLSLEEVAVQYDQGELFAAFAAGGVCAVGVAAALGLLRLFGARAAALVAALPLISMPTLAWLTLQESALLAAEAAAGSLTAALFVTSLVAIGCALCRHGEGAARVPVLPQRALLTIAVAGIVSGTTVYGHAWLPPAVCGALAALPVVGAMTLLHVAVSGGRRAFANALPAYLRGALASVAFFGSLALALLALPPLLAWLAAIGLGALVLNAEACGHGLHRCRDAATAALLGRGAAQGTGGLLGHKRGRATCWRAKSWSRSSTHKE
jgi:hypothetical protein